ncbi:MBL fold metallo-hydrolase [Acrocarpospora corrugata]|uniref:MBL fold metallo-hydrolase n=1 Tax=Acrocarpospora corrugata TaxID=35763 RepID=UPI001FE8DFB6|nr:MBL fold metallo-hydrolase [Acrocarpospora corrugata]
MRRWVCQYPTYKPLDDGSGRIQPLGQADPALRPRLIRFAHTACNPPPPGTTVSTSGCKSQAEGVTVLRQVAEGVLIHESEFCQSNSVVVQGRAGVLLIDPGVQGHEMACLANDLRELSQPVVAGFSTHPHWDHLLWHAGFGAAATASMCTLSCRGSQ